MAAMDIQVLIFSGSLNSPSHTRANMEFIAGLLTDRAVGVYLWDPHDHPLPFHDPRYHHDPHSNESEEVRSLARLAERADAFVWGTPVYHNSFSGILKNALDNLSYLYFRHKPVALVSNGGERTGIQPLDQLRIVARGLYGVAIPTQVVTISSDFERIDDRYVIVNEVIHKRLGLLVNELLMYAQALKQLHQA
jgi:azobenzene reductase